MDEIQQRADLIGVPFVTLHEIAHIAGISRQTLWRLPPDQQPATFRMGGSQMIGIDDAVAWAHRYWQTKQAA